MFAGAAREAVFARPEVVRRINRDFIPVALKAALVNNPPGGIEGALYAELSRSKPAPQGICVANSAGKALAWALSFDDDKSILSFLDAAAERYRQLPDASQPVAAHRYMRFPSHPLSDVEDSRQPIDIPEQHAARDRCPALPRVEAGTLVGRIVGRALDDDGRPIADTLRQEHYMEARFEVPVAVQQALAQAARDAGAARFPLPASFARSLVRHAFLGQLDVNPLGDVPGSRNDRQSWRFHGQPISSPSPEIVRLRIIGRSDVAGSQDKVGFGTDGRLWEHAVQLRWEGIVDLRDARVERLVVLADGQEQLKWASTRHELLQEADVRHLMAGHPIDLQCGVRYGLVAAPCADDEVANR